MRNLPLLTAGAAAALLLGLTGCTAAATTTAMHDSGSGSSSSSSAATRTGTFDGLNDKKVSGSVTVSGSSIELTGFSSDEGPDLHIYLASGTSEDAATSGTEIDAVKFDAASQKFTIPSGVDVSSYDYVVIHCDKAKAVFGAAELSK
jgi:hypothetical protein